MNFTKIQLQEDGSYTADDLNVPNSPGNRHYKMVLEDIADGATVLPVALYVETYVETWLDKRLKSIADGGYGTMSEQLEMFGEQGEVAFMAHIQTVKTNHPKPV
jgi:hypothetical protein